MNSNVGVFAWIRDSVRRAVLLGFSDAVEQLGDISDKESLHPQLATVLRQSPALKYEASLNREPLAAAPRADRKRLGRSLAQFQTEETATGAE